MQDAIAGGVFRTGLSFTQETAGRFYQFCAETLGNAAEGKPSLFSHAALLHDLELPAIDDVADEDFVGIRLESEDFAEFRTVLGRALHDTSKEVEEGRELNKSFRNHLGEVRWRAELLRRDTRDKVFAKFLQPKVQGIAIGSLISTAAAAAATAAQSTPVDLLSLAARFGTSAVLGTLFALLLYSSPDRKQRLLRFYDILLDERHRSSNE